MSLGSTIGRIWTGAQHLWSAVEAEIDADVKAVRSALPASALPAFDIVVSDLKQDASDALTAAQGALSAVAPGVIAGAEKLLDDALVGYTNGLALPLVPATNKAVDDLAAAALAAINSWALKAKANLAANNPPLVKQAAPAPKGG